MIDFRDDLRDRLCMMLMGHNIDISDIQNEIFIILDQYEISSRSTELAVLSEDRNDFLVKKFLIAKTVKGCTERTIKYYREILQAILPAIGKTVDEIEADDIRLYLALRQKRDGIAKTTANNELRVLRTFFTYLMTEELIQKNPTLKIDSIKSKKIKKNAFTEIEIEQIRNCVKNNRERAIVEILLSTGCRVGELVNIRLDELKDDKVVVHGKGEKDRTVFLNAKAQIAISNYLAERTDNNPYLFAGGYFRQYSVGGASKYGSVKNGEWYKDPSLVKPDTHTDIGAIESIVKKLKKRSGITTECHPHKFRRTCATLSLKRGMPIEQVSKMLGHESIATTQIYLDLNDEDLHLAHKKYVV